MKSADGRFEYQDKDGEPLPEGSTLADVGRFSYLCRSPTRGGQFDSGRCSINISNAGYQIENRNWMLTGTIDAPTIAPSINCEDCWHGCITAGVYRTTSGETDPNQ